MQASDLNGLIVKYIDIVDDPVGEGDMLITTECGRKFLFTHYQNCCEHVSIYDVVGDLKKLIGKKLVSVTVDDNEPEGFDGYTDCPQWTNFTFRTTEDTVIARWLGDSNGYYSTDVTLEELANGR